MAAIIGPNGCGKSNIADAISWVLGEQSAKTLRGSRMEDVIFAGTRDRKPTGMAEVSLTLIDPEQYDGPDARMHRRKSKSGRIAERGLGRSGIARAGAEETEHATEEAQPGKARRGRGDAAAGSRCTARSELETQAFRASPPVAVPESAQSDGGGRRAAVTGSGSRA